MRVIAGKFKKQNLFTIPGFALRPTADRAKEALFNILGESVVGARVLDLFAGTGALGLEALSRGAAQAMFVENNRESLNILKQNCQKMIPALGKNEYTIQPMDVENFLTAKSSLAQEPYDLIFADPPYTSEWYANALPMLQASHLCGSETLVVVEMARDMSLKNQENWKKEDERIYGKTRFEFYTLQTC